MQAQTKLQQHIEVMIPDVKEELVKICKTLDLKVAIEEQNVWLIGNPLAVNIAQKHLNKLYIHDLSNVVVECSESKKLKELEQLFRPHKEIPEDVQLTNQPTAYLCLALFLGKVTPPTGTQLFVVIKECCSRADLYARNMNKHPPAKYEEYFNKLCAEMKNRESSHKVVYLSDHMPLDLRNILENDLEKIHQPTAVIKCKKRHWSCYIYPNERASAAQDFVDSSLKVYTHKSLKALWSELPNEILATKELYSMERKQKEGSQNKEIEDEVLGEVNDESLDENGRYVKTTPPIPTKLGEKKHTLLSSVNLQDIQYLYVNHTPEIQEIQATDRIKVTFDLESIHIMADTEEMAKQVETKIKKYA